MDITLRIHELRRWLARAHDAGMLHERLFPTDNKLLEVRNDYLNEAMREIINEYSKPNDDE